MMEPKDIQRFISKIKKTDNCWIWLAYISKDGYGHFSLEKINKVAHKVSYELFKGEVPEGLDLDHLCRNRRCVNPEHLEAVTPKENILRGVGFSAINARKNQCPYGHKYDSKNNRGDRVCMTCRRAAGARNRLRCKILGIDRNRYKKIRKGNLL